MYTVKAINFFQPDQVFLLFPPKFPFENLEFFRKIHFLPKLKQLYLSLYFCKTGSALANAWPLEKPLNLLHQEGMQITKRYVYYNRKNKLNFLKKLDVMDLEKSVSRYTIPWAITAFHLDIEWNRDWIVCTSHNSTSKSETFW